MPRPKQTEDQIAAMRERILDAARDVLLEEGPEALSIRTIADRVGVSHMVLYTYFENHAALIAAFTRRQRARMQARHEENLRQAESGDVLAVMRESLVFYAWFARERPRVYRFLWVLPMPACRGLDDQCSHQHGRMQDHLQHLARLVRVGVERGVFAERDPDLAAAVVFGMVNAPLILYHSGRLPDDALRERLETESLDAAMAYLLKGE